MRCPLASTSTGPGSRWTGGCESDVRTVEDVGTTVTGRKTDDDERIQTASV